MIRRQSGKRRGVTLVELMAALAAITMVLGLCVALMTMLLKLSETGHEHLTDEARLARLARLFRSDVRNAVEATGLNKTNDHLVLLDADSVIVEYQLRYGDLVRTEEFDGITISRERLRLPMASHPRFEMRNENGQSMMILVLDRKRKKSSPGLVHIFRVEAALGGSRRFETMEASLR